MNPSVSARRRLLEHGRCVSFVSYDKAGIPRRLEVCEKTSAQPVLAADMDGIDGMVFCVPDAALATLPPPIQQDAVLCFSHTLNKHTGGKISVVAPPEMEKLFSAEGFRAAPSAGEGKAFNRLMSATAGSVMERMPSLSPLPERYEIISDKNVLRQSAAAISTLFMQNAPYAQRAEKSAYYSPAAIEARIDDPHVSAFAIRERKAGGKIVSFIRGYHQDGMGVYFSDWVADKSYRDDHPGMHLMQAALDALKDTPDKRLFLIAGEKVMEFYGKRLGFQPVSDCEVNLPSGRFLFKLVPQRAVFAEIGERLSANAAAPSRGRTP